MTASASEALEWTGVSHSTPAAQRPGPCPFNPGTKLGPQRPWPSIISEASSTAAAAVCSTRLRPGQGERFSIPISMRLGPWSRHQAFQSWTTADWNGNGVPDLKLHGLKPTAKANKRAVQMSTAVGGEAIICLEMTAGSSVNPLVYLSISFSFGSKLQGA